MRNAIFIAGLVMGFAGLLLPQPAAAHKAIVFAYTESGNLMVEAGFSGGRACMGCPVQVLDAKTGRELASAKTDDNGVCSIPIPESAQEAVEGLKLVLSGGEGHRGEWLVRPDEYLNQAATPQDETSPSAAQAKTPGEEASHAGEASLASVDATQLRRIVNEALDVKLAPLKRELLEDKGPSVSEVAGGIGYLVGIAGILAWAASRKGRKGGEGRV